MSKANWRAPWIYSSPVITILLCHYFVDIYSSLIPPLIGVVQTELSILPATAALLLGMGSICSGLAQPLFAWISDLTNSRIYGPLGILLASLFITFLGYSNSIAATFCCYAVGMIGIGMFHPIATAKIGEAAGNQRGFAISLFFVFGMSGFFTGSLIGPSLTTSFGSLTALRYLAVPGIVMAILLHWNINKPNDTEVAQPQTTASLADYDWWSIIPLYFSSVFRFMVNMAIVYLIVRWVEASVATNNPDFNAEEISHQAAPLAGQAHAIMFIGQGLSGLLAGALVKQGRESKPLLLMPILFAPFMMSLAFLQPSTLSLSICLFAGVGFAAMTPITISVGQRLMPGHLRLASGIMLGGAWALGSIGPWLAEWGIKIFGLPNAIIGTGVVLMLAGLCSIPVSCPPDD